jgi:hypothetical protein
MATDKKMIYIILAVIALVLLTNRNDDDGHYKKPYLLTGTGTSYTLTDNSSPAKTVDVTVDGLEVTPGMSVSMTTSASKTGTTTPFYVIKVDNISGANALTFSTTKAGAVAGAAGAYNGFYIL